MQKMTDVVSKIKYWSIVIFPFSIAIAPGLANSIIGFMLSAFLIEKAFLKKEKLFNRSTPIIIFLVFICFGALSFINTVSFKVSFNGIIKLLKYFVIFVIYLESVKDKGYCKAIAISIACGISLITIDAFWQLYSGRDFIRGNMLHGTIGLARPSASFPGSNAMGIYLTALTPFVAGLALFLTERKEKIFFVFAAILGGLGVYLSLSRGAAAGLFLSLLLLSLVKKNKIITSVLIIFVLVYPFVMPQNIKDWAKSVKYNPLVMMTCQTRIGIYRNTLHMISDHPFVGVGINTFSRNYNKYRSADVEATNPTAKAYYAHNNFLHMAGEMGLLGLSVFLVFIFFVLKSSWMAFRKNNDPYYRAFAVSVFAAIIAFLINGFTETSLYHPRIVMIFWVLVGLGLALGKITDVEVVDKE
jgi:O-antigen ligase